jgi:hypothetical protein
MTALLSSPSTIHVPQLVENYLDRVLPNEGMTPRRVKIAQTGDLWLKPYGRALRFSAVEELRIEKIRLLWEAKVRVAPLVSLHVTDRYEDGYGSLNTTLLGIPVTQARGSEIAVGQVMRYLAELPWVPYAMRDNPLLEWREIDEVIVEVATAVGHSHVAVGLRFDDAGNVLAAFGHRPRREGGKIVTRPWMGLYGDYAELGGIRIPTRAEVRWETPDGPFTYFRGTITSLELS